MQLWVVYRLILKETIFVVAACQHCNVQMGIIGFRPKVVPNYMQGPTEIMDGLQLVITSTYFYDPKIDFQASNKSLNS